MIGLDIRGLVLADRFLFLRQQGDPELLDDGLGNLVLDRENVGQVAVVAIGPDVATASAVDQLGVDPDPRARLADAPLEDVADPEFGGDLGQIGRLALVGETGVAPDHEQTADLAEVGDDIFADPVGEIFLFGIAAHVVERQHGDRRTRLLDRVGRDLGRGAGFPGTDDNIIDPNWNLDILELLVAGVLEHDIGLGHDIVANRGRHRNSARSGDRFDPRGDIDSVAIQIVPVDDHIAEVDPDPELDLAVVCRFLIALAHVALDFERTFQGADNALKFHQRAIAGKLEGPAIVRGDTRVEQIAPQRFKRLERGNLVRTHEPAIANHISRKDRRQAPLHCASSLSITGTISMARCVARVRRGIVAMGLKALDNGRAVAIPGLVRKAGAQAHRFMPRWLLRKVTAAIKL